MTRSDRPIQEDMQGHCQCALTPGLIGLSLKYKVEKSFTQTLASAGKRGDDESDFFGPAKYREIRIEDGKKLPLAT